MQVRCLGEVLPCSIGQKKHCWTPLGFHTSAWGPVALCTTRAKPLRLARAPHAQCPAQADGGVCRITVQNQEQAQTRHAQHPSFDLPRTYVSRGVSSDRSCNSSSGHGEVVDSLATKKRQTPFLPFRPLNREGRRLKNGSLSASSTPRRGVIQGCALSCLIFNMVMAPLVIKTQNRQDMAPLEAHANDIFCRAMSDELMRASVSTLMRFLEPLGIPLQRAKTQCLRTGPGSDKVLEISDAVLVPTHEVKVLGQGLVNFVPGRGTQVLAERVNKYLQRVHTITALRLPYVQKLRVLVSMASSVLAFSPWQVQPSKVHSSCRSALIGALFPKLPRHRASEIVVQVLAPGHLLDSPNDVSLQACYTGWTDVG